VPIPTFYGDEICYVNGLKYAKAILRAVYRYTETARAVRSWPEYEEYFVPYALKRSLYSCHHYAFRLVGRNQRVLEIGCADGAFGGELVRAGNSLTGVDRNPQVPPAAGYDRVIDADFEHGLTSRLRNSEREFDRVLVLDVLEHMRDPAKLLSELKTQLAPRGKLIVSVPNAVNLTIRLMILFGHFSYSDRGILDWSHLRFFTRQTIRKLLRQNGYRVTGRHYTVIPLERVVPIRPENAFMRFASRVLRVLTGMAPGLFAYEIVLVARVELNY
jgi:2-polyprenyl-3-methyl-5-hydroxy-6-metoxy-1,4-benzoquinol methylase